MSVTCPRCPFGILKPTQITYVQSWGTRVVVLPNFAAHRCDCCGHTRYDVAALSQVTLLLGPEDGEWRVIPRRRPLHAEGPSERGPRSWSP